MFNVIDFNFTYDTIIDMSSLHRHQNAVVT
jgi:hypothetical protein